MLRAPTFLAQSQIPGAGLGLFAAEPIRAGETIWQFDKGADRIICDVPPGIPTEFVQCYGFAFSPLTFLLCVDDARFINHSCDPNGKSDGPGLTVAARDIAAGEEITEDYREFEPAGRIAAMPFVSAA